MGATDTRGAGRVAVENSLEHYGVKGMKWGVRKDRFYRDSQEVRITAKKGKGIVKVRGGSGRGVSEEAADRAATRQKGKRSTVDSLTNAELKRYVERKKLEEQYMSFIAKEIPRKSKGRKFVEEFIKGEIDGIKSGKPGPTVKALTTAVTVAGMLKLGAGGTHRGKMGKLAVSTILAAGTGKRRKGV